MVRGNNWQPTCRLIKPLPEAPLESSPREHIADIEISNQRECFAAKLDQPYRLGDNFNDPDYNHALEFLHDQINQIGVTID